MQIFAQVEVLSTRFCDGIVDCSVTMEDELSGLCVSRHICQAGPRISIAQSQICDGTIDCDDQSDESNCPDRFECASLGGAKVNFQYTRGVSLKRVTSGEAHLQGLNPGQRSSEEASQRWRAVGDTVPFDQARNRPDTSSADSDMSCDCAK